MRTQWERVFSSVGKCQVNALQFHCPFSKFRKETGTSKTNRLDLHEVLICS